MRIAANDSQLARRTCVPQPAQPELPYLMVKPMTPARADTDTPVCHSLVSRPVPSAAADRSARLRLRLWEARPCKQSPTEAGRGTPSLTHWDTSPPELTAAPLRGRDTLTATLTTRGGGQILTAATLGETGHPLSATLTARDGTRRPG